MQNIELSCILDSEYHTAKLILILSFTLRLINDFSHKTKTKDRNREILKTSRNLYRPDLKDKASYNL